MPTLEALPDDIAALKRIIAEMARDAVSARAEIARLKFQLARYRRAEFGRSSEKLARETEQLELAIEALETDQAERLASAAPEAAAIVDSVAAAQKPARRRLPEHLPREEVMHRAGPACPSCGGALRRIGEDATETLDYVPGRFKVIRHVREKLSCRTCDTVVAAPAPDHAIARGRAGAGLLAHILVSKYDDHLPLYRQAEIFAREGVGLETSTLSGWVGATAAALKPLVDALAAEIMASDTLHVDDTPVPVLAPGTGKTKTGRLWVYVRDERPFAGARPPAALFCYSADRKGEHPRTHLKAFTGVIHADGYAGFNELFAGNRITEAACWAHVRRKFFDVHAATGSPIAEEALDRIGDLYKIDKTIAGLPPDVRRGERQQRSKPIAEALAAWAETTLRRLSRKSELAKAFRYMRSRWKALLRCFDDGRLALDNNPAERALRCVAIGRKNYLFAGSDAGGHRAAAIYSLIETAKLNRRNPQHYLADVLTRIADHPPGKSPISCPGTGRPPTFSAPPPDPAPSPSAYEREACGLADLGFDRSAADDGADDLEEAAFLAGLLSGCPGPALLPEPLLALSHSLVDAAQVFQRGIGAAQHVHRGGERENMQQFLEAVDRMVTIEHQTDEQERAVTVALIKSDIDCRHLHLVSGIAGHLESAADALLRASSILRDHVLGEVMFA